MFTLILVLIVIVSILLGAVVLVQNSKGGGLASGLGASNQIMGVRKTTDALEKLTWGFAISLIVLALIGNLAIPHSSGGAGAKSDLDEKIKNIPTPTAPKAPAAPAGGAAPQQR